MLWQISDNLRGSIMAGRTTKFTGKTLNQVFKRPIGYGALKNT